jgi:hypothetical protein
MIAGKRQKDESRSGMQPYSEAAFVRPLSLAHLMLSFSTNPQHNEKNNHYLPGCFLHRIDRRFLCRPSLQPETHITRQHTTRRRQRRDSNLPGFQRGCIEPSSKRISACHGLIWTWRAALTIAGTGPGSFAGSRYNQWGNRSGTKQQPLPSSGSGSVKRGCRGSSGVDEPDCAAPAIGRHE